MPCYDDRDEPSHKLTDMLCRVLRALPPSLILSFDHDIRDWWERHKADDQKAGR